MAIIKAAESIANAAEGFVKVVGALVFAIITTIVANEMDARLPRLNRRLLDRALRRVPKNLRDRYAEEWERDLSEIPGHLSRLKFALGFPKAASKIAATEARGRAADTPPVSAFRNIGGAPKAYPGAPEIYFYKNIDNSRLVYMVDPIARREMRLITATVVVCFLIALVYLGQHCSAIEYGYKIEDLRAKCDQTAEVNRTLKLEAATLKDPARIDALARTMGLVPANEAQRMDEGASSHSDTPMMSRANDGEIGRSIKHNSNHPGHHSFNSAALPISNQRRQTGADQPESLCPSLRDLKTALVCGEDKYIVLLFQDDSIVCLNPKGLDNTPGALPEAACSTVPPAEVQSKLANWGCTSSEAWEDETTGVGCPAALPGLHHVRSLEKAKDPDKDSHSAIERGMGEIIPAP